MRFVISTYFNNRNYNISSERLEIKTNELKTKSGNYKETMIKFISRCGENMPYFMPEKLNLKNIEYEYTRYGGVFVKSIKKGMI